MAQERDDVRERLLNHLAHAHGRSKAELARALKEPIEAIVDHIAGKEPVPEAEQKAPAEPG